MEKQKFLKKTAAMLLAGTMLCGSAAWMGTGFTKEVQATETSTPEPPTIDLTQTGTLNIVKQDGKYQGVPGAGFSLYQIMSLDKDAKGIYTYTPTENFKSALSGVMPDKLGEYSAQEIEELADALAKQAEMVSPTKSEQITEADGTTTFDELALGYYLVVETKVPDGYIPGKPFLVALPYTNEGSDGGTQWMYEITAEPKNYSTSIEKEINKDLETEDDKVSQDGTVKVGDYVPYKISTQTPNYSDEMYKDEPVKFIITDVMSDGLKAVDNDTYPVEVYVDDILVEEPDCVVTIDATATGEIPDLTITFAENFLKNPANCNKDVRVTYYAEVTEKAVAGIDKNTNQPFLEYTSKPGEDAKADGDKVPVYTFDLDVMKFTKEGKTKPLAGAIFRLYEGEVGDDKLLEEITTQNDGKISFEQLDEGIYHLVEIKAPEGFTLLANPIKVEIKALRDAEGEATGDFELYINEKKVEDTEGVYVSHTEQNEGTSYVAVENHKGFNLPETGGMGIVLFLAVGVAGIVVVSVLMTKKSKETK